MAINITTITQLISDFRALSQKDSISPESLGVLLQRLADLINSAASDADYKAIYDAFQKFVANIAAVPTAIVSMVQGSNDKNNVLMNITKSNLAKGLQTTSTNQIFINPATTERAGAMRAQHVVDLNSALDGLSQATQSIDEIKQVTDCPKISTYVKDGRLYVANTDYYVENGYCAFVFRFTKKRNRMRFDSVKDVKRCSKHKGWHVIGGLPNNVKIVENGKAIFRKEALDQWHYEKSGFAYSETADAIIGAKGTGLDRHVPWGKKKVKVSNKVGNYMMRRFRYAIGFGKAYSRNTHSLSPAELASNLAEFSVIFDPCSREFHFGK